MADWPTVAIATIPALITGAVGYGAARLQLRGTLRQAEADLDRVREQHSEEHLRHRQATYHDLLDAIREVHVVPAATDALVEWEAEWGPAYTHRLNAVTLFGTAAVRDAAIAYNRLMLDIAKAAGNEFATAAWRAEWGRRLDSDVVPTFNRLLDAMRADVAPEP